MARTLHQYSREERNGVLYADFCEVVECDTLNEAEELAQLIEADPEKAGLRVRAVPTNGACYTVTTVWADDLDAVVDDLLANEVVKS